MKRRRRRHSSTLDGPWSIEPGAERAFEPAEDARRQETRRPLRTGEHKTPFMLETESERQLLFTRSNVQSTMRIAEPDALVSSYTQKMMSFLLFTPYPLHIVMIGLGGGSLPKFCYRNLPSTQITVVEIDADVIALREAFCVPADNERFRIVHDDGARFIATLADPVDVILVDAFDARGIAPSLATSNFYGDAASRLGAGGILVMNLSGEPSRLPLHLGRLRAAFGSRLLTLPIESRDNVLVFAFRTRPPAAATAALEKCAQDLQSRLLLEFPKYLQRLYRNESPAPA